MYMYIYTRIITVVTLHSTIDIYIYTYIYKNKWCIHMIV